MINKVRVTVTDGMGRQKVLEDSVDNSERTPSIAAKDLIGSVVLDDGDTITIEFFHETC